jgi:hypothetical protein
MPNILRHLSYFYRSTIVLICSFLLVLAMGATTGSAQEWRKLDNSKRKVQFSAPGLEGWTPGISVKVADSFAGRSEWVCWRKFKSKEANACVTYQVSSYPGFEYTRATDIASEFPAFEKVDYTVSSKIQGFESPIGEIDTARVSVEAGHMKNCFTFNRYWGGTRMYVTGWYCAAAETALPEDVIEQIISTISIKESP